MVMETPERHGVPHGREGLDMCDGHDSTTDKLVGWDGLGLIWCFDLVFVWEGEVDGRTPSATGCRHGWRRGSIGLLTTRQRRQAGWDGLGLIWCLVWEVEVDGIGRPRRTDGVPPWQAGGARSTCDGHDSADKLVGMGWG
jgi:hypothetical protein